MPCLKIMTNILKSNIPKDFLTKIIPVLAEGVRKSPDMFLCVIQDDCQLIINGNSTLPGVIATLESIGNLGSEDNKRIVKLLTAFMEKELGVPPNRFFLTFYDLETYNVGKGGVTIETLLEKK
ncbi:macrophage migration inhibitory factor-like [Vanessa atalanta]|uniref:macrophage migration inhibitory factor-like n=1 Tax=Vanessa atalanta TaxID=42275 RepID=UPI001FCE1774|nr:macrophage migration inhibitory factor-like [Vanessa atalanta]